MKTFFINFLSGSAALIFGCKQENTLPRVAFCGLTSEKRLNITTLIPALIITAFISTCLIFAPDGFFHSKEIAESTGSNFTAAAPAGFGIYLKKSGKMG